MTRLPDDILRDRLAKARQDLRTARLNMEAGAYDGAANRAYYSAFHAARALLGSQGLITRKHSGVLSLFELHFAKGGLWTCVSAACCVSCVGSGTLPTMRTWSTSRRPKPPGQSRTRRSS